MSLINDTTNIVCDYCRKNFRKGSGAYIYFFQRDAALEKIRRINQNPQYLDVDTRHLHQGCACRFLCSNMNVFIILRRDASGKLLPKKLRSELQLVGALDDQLKLFESLRYKAGIIKDFNNFLSNLNMDEMDALVERRPVSEDILQSLKNKIDCYYCLHLPGAFEFITRSPSSMLVSIWTPSDERLSAPQIRERLLTVGVLVQLFPETSFLQKTFTKLHPLFNK